METPYLTVPQVALMFGVTEDGVRAACVRGDLPAHKVGRVWQIKNEGLAQFSFRSGSGERRAPRRPQQRGRAEAMSLLVQMADLARQARPVSGEVYLSLDAQGGWTRTPYPMADEVQICVPAFGEPFIFDDRQSVTPQK